MLKRKGRGRFCSKECWYKTKLGKAPWNKGGTGLQVAWNKGKECAWREEKHVNWKEVGYGYSAVHNWIRKKLPYPKRCSLCNRVKKLEWANKSGEYKRDIEDWIALCRKCHVNYDRSIGIWGLATKKFGL